MYHNELTTPSRLIYVSSFEYPSTHGHPLHALSMARAFSKLYADRFLFVIGGGVRDKSLAGVPHASPFKARASVVKKLHLRSIGYAFWLFWFLLRNPNWQKSLVIFTNDLKLAACIGFVRLVFPFSLVCEVHGFVGPVTNWLVARTANKMVFVTTGLQKRFLKQYSYPRDKTSVIGNAVDAAFFDDLDGESLRQDLKISEKSTVIGYVGRFKPMESDKGVNFLIDTLAELPNDVMLMLVGGTDEEISDGKQRAKEKGVDSRVLFVPYVSFDERLRYFAVADILAYVPAVGDRFLDEDTSPMKLFEYMAAGRPVIASRFAAFKEALEEDAYYIEPGDHKAFNNTVRYIQEHPQETNTMVLRAKARVKNRTWDARAMQLKQFYGT